MRLPLLAWRLLRFRVAAMVWTFMLIGAAHPDGLPASWLGLLPAVAALGASYVAATSANDLADEGVDRINHPGDRARPLVSGDASRGDLRLLHVCACAAALVVAAPLGPLAVGVVAASLAIGVAYSLPPLRLSYRTWLAPLALGAAYVLVPYCLGALAAGRSPVAADGRLVAALFALFLARIVLKDYRDLPGDTAYGKPTLLLRFGSGVTCVISLCALAAGAVLLVTALRPPFLVAAALLSLLGGAALLLRRLHGADDGRAQQVAIGLGARLGNGALLVVLAWLALGGEGASEAARTAFAWLLAGLVGASVVALAARPEQVVIGYKG
jgi:homogentisate phytyltransferase/homogentisate geranylgeranyltransferase